ncbi:MAG: STAS domain-containing protein [Magnetococcales bacterium]|nr:STAS domain-containing protein [Magnetococcales bacterium]
MTVSTKVKNNVVTIRIEGRFDQKMCAEFRRAHVNLPSGTIFEVDCSSITSVDSVMLGMLIEMRALHGGEQAKIAIKHCKPEMRRLLRMTEYLDFGQESDRNWTDVLDCYAITNEHDDPITEKINDQNSNCR